jgi:DNA/RNA-binding domain of Phe-tRNA-synthetase-like protein
MHIPHITPAWEVTFSGAHMGLLLLAGINNSQPAPALEAHKQHLCAQLRGRYGHSDRSKLRQHPVLQAYKDYYRQFNKTYHVLLQLESVVYKGKDLAQVNPLVDAVFAAELEKLILTAGHDADTLQPPVTIDASRGDERMTQLSGQQVTLKANDMCMADAEGIVCSILYGQDRRTQITPATRRALYVAYVPAGIEPGYVTEHLETIERNVRLFAPEVRIGYQQVYGVAMHS